MGFENEKVKDTCEKGNSSPPSTPPTAFTDDYSQASHMRHNTRDSPSISQISTTTSPGISASTVSDSSVTRMYFNCIDSDWKIAHATWLGLEVKSLSKVPQPVSFTTISEPTETVSIVPDVNCFYRSLSYCITGSEWYHAQIRHVLVDWMKENNDIISERANQEDYANTSRVSQLGEYATEVEIFAAASMLNTPIWTYSPYARHDDETEYQWQQHDPLPGASSDFPLSEKCIFLNNQHANFEPVLRCSNDKPSMSGT